MEEHQSIDNFRDSKHNMCIQAKRDPKKEWLQLRYSVIAKELQWAMKYWTKEWSVPVASKKGSKGVKQAEDGTSQKSNSPTTNTIKAT